MDKLKYIWVTLVPMIFMTATTLVASYELFFIFIEKSANASNPADALTFKIDAGLVVTMAALVVVTIVDSIYKWIGYFNGKREIVTSEVVEWANDLEVH